MRIAHFAAFAPSKSGMYESTKDQIKYERKEGLDSVFIDGLRPNFVGRKDGWLETVDWKIALDSDVWVIHSNIPPPLAEQRDKFREKNNTVAIMHGPCENMLLKEWGFLTKNIDEAAFTITHINSIWYHDACVVLNQHEYDISVLYDEYDKLIYIPNSIDLDRVRDTTKWKYRNRPAIISCDAPRIEKLPVHILFAMSKVVEKIPDARLNYFGIPLDHVEFFRNMVCRVKKRHLDFDCIENFHMKLNTLMPFIAGADIGFNNNYSGICSRVHMEMMACGVPVVSYNGDYTKYHAKCFDLNSIAEKISECWNDLQSTDLSSATKEYAFKNFDRSVYIKDYVKLYERLAEEKNGKAPV
jgi:glycosyltransferase involved in cell wall biosynthesis